MTQKNNGYFERNCFASAIILEKIQPIEASKTKLTQIQSNIKTIQNEILSTMMRGEQTASLSVNTSNYSTLLETPKSAYYAGEIFDGSIVLGRVDDQTKPNRVELTLDGKPLVEGKDFSFEGGRVKLNVSAGSPGDHTLEGNLIFKQDGQETEVPVSRSFSTISKPNAAVIAADKMNVVYRGVDNPMTISIPGIAYVRYVLGFKPDGTNFAEKLIKNLLK